MILIEKRLEESSISVFEPKEFDEDMLIDSKGEFENFKNRGIILECNFEDSVWMLSNEGDKIRIVFNFNEVKFEKESKTRYLGRYDDFISAVKSYLIYKLKNRVISSIREMLNSFKKILDRTYFLNIDFINEVRWLDMHSKDYYENLGNLIEFLDFYNMNIDDEYLTLFYHQQDSYVAWMEREKLFNQRELTDFDSMFKFGEVLEQFWESASSQKKEEFFPIKLWWEITTRIPLRITEFVLTPNNCISKEDDKFYITVRRSRLKGTVNKTVSHKVDLDYSEHKVRINEELYELVKEYKDLVDQYDYEQNFYGMQDKDWETRKFLLSYRSYYKYLKLKKIAVKNNFKLGLFSTENLRNLYYKFFSEIVVNGFGLEVVDKESQTLQDNQIGFISLMDTRHFAFINLVLNDIEPLIIKKIAGHSSINSSYHYYNHLDKFVKCYTYSMARRLAINKRMKQSGAILQLGISSNMEVDEKFRQAFGISKDLPYREVDGGKCFHKDKNPKECLIYDNNCILCDYFEHNGEMSNNKIKQQVDYNNEQMESIVTAIKAIIKNYAKSNKYKEEYGQKINQIKGIANENSILISKHLM